MYDSRALDENRRNPSVGILFSHLSANQKLGTTLVLTDSNASLSLLLNSFMKTLHVSYVTSYNLISRFIRNDFHQKVQRLLQQGISTVDTLQPACENDRNTM